SERSHPRHPTMSHHCPNAPSHNFNHNSVPLGSGWWAGEDVHTHTHTHTHAHTHTQTDIPSCCFSPETFSFPIRLKKNQRFAAAGEPRRLTLQSVSFMNGGTLHTHTHARTHTHAHTHTRTHIHTHTHTRAHTCTHT